MKFAKAKSVSIRTAFGGETFVQQLLADDPTLLTLGDLFLRGKERIQTSSGRLDLLFESSDGKRWYEVEVQLGSTDETHIIRTLEYWDNERRHHPEKEHTAVIVAEHITSRFFNVIGLFNKHIPIVAIQMTGLDVEGNYTIHFTKVLDHSVQEVEEEDDYQPTDRAYWVKRTSEATMELVDEIFNFAKEENSSGTLKYNKGYITIKKETNGSYGNFINLRPQKKEVRMSVMYPKDQELESLVSDTGMTLEYNDQRERYFLYFSREEFEQNKLLIRRIIQKAYNAEASSPEMIQIGSED